MTRRADEPRARRDYFVANGVLLVTRDAPAPAGPAPGQPRIVGSDRSDGPEVLLACWDDGSVTALNGHVDLGTGIRTALAQIVADELDVSMDCIAMVLGDTASAPNQGATIASASIQVHAAPLRQAAAQARAWLLAEAAARLGATVEECVLRAGVVRVEADPARRLGCADVLRGRHVELALAADVRVKAPAEHRLVGQSVPRVDIPAKAAGELVFVHDMRMPGMLHGRVVRPPYAGVDAGDFVGHTLLGVDRASIGHVPGVVAVVVIGDFVGIVAEREEHAEQAMRELDVRWKPWPGIAPLDDLAQALKAQPSTRRLLVERGDVDAAIGASPQPLARSYVWPYQMHASIGPSCALADWRGAPGAGGAAADAANAAANGARGSDGAHGSDGADGADGAHGAGGAHGAHGADGADGAGGAGDAAAKDAAASRLASDGDGGPAARVPTLIVWAGTQNPHVLRADLALLTGVAESAVDVVRMEAAGCYGRNGADDVAADAALLSRAAGRPVRVQLSREQEHAWEPKGAAQLMEVRGGLDAAGGFGAYDFETSYPSNGAPTLALLLTRTIEPRAQVYAMADRTAVPPYAVPNLRVAARDMAPILRASWLRGVSALPNSFAHESYVDELATAARADPVAFRLAHLADRRAAELVAATAARAGWVAHTAPRQQPADGALLRGQGFAHARYLHGAFPGQGAAWAAWVADVEVDRRSGEVHVRRVVVGHDAGLVVNPTGVQHQIHGNVLQTTSRALKERVELDPQTQAVAAREWGSYPILDFREVPRIEVLMMPRQGEPPLGAGESASVPGTAAIANAIFDATGVRFCSPPFTPEVVKAALDARLSAAAPVPADAEAIITGRPWNRAWHRGWDFVRGRASNPPSDPVRGGALNRARRVSAETRGTASGGSLHHGAAPRRKPVWVVAGALAAALGSVAAAAFGWRAEIAPVDAAAAAGRSIYTDDVLARGRAVAAVGNCVTCHTAPGGAPNAGGRVIETPFGAVVSTNLTPDPATGLGAWSFSAFQRAMREGVSRDGHRLYPAFPYTAFTRIDDADLTALYAHLMAQPAVRADIPAARLAFPFNLRPLMAFWNALFLDPGPRPADATRPAEWNRGAYLVNGAGHCSACHSPRNVLGAERGGAAFLHGAVVDGWEAPPLGAQTRAPLRWTEDELFRYLRFGHSDEHGIAGGPMAPVVTQLAAAPDADVRAMAHYLASLAPSASLDPVPAGPATASAAMESAPPSGVADRLSTEAQARRARSHAPQAVGASAAQRQFEAACGACHHDGSGPMVFGLNLPLALNSNLHSDRPENLIRTILDGIRTPANAEIGHMPAFRASLDDRQIARLAGYMRERFAPDAPPWTGLEDAVARLRGAGRAE